MNQSQLSKADLMFLALVSSGKIMRRSGATGTSSSKSSVVEVSHFCLLQIGQSRPLVTKLRYFVQSARVIFMA